MEVGTVEQTATIVSFLRGIGLTIEATTLMDDGFLPAIAVREGALFYDAARLTWPGDLLHEAGHLAVTDPEERGTTSEFDSSGGDEMAAIAWSYAAALAAGIDPEVVFHTDGYKGDGPWLVETFASGRYVGLPMLQYYGLAAREGAEGFPKMQRWLR